VIEFVVDVEEPLRESTKFSASLIFQLGAGLSDGGCRGKSAHADQQPQTADSHKCGTRALQAG
jgi:hypothetical protein